MKPYSRNSKSQEIMQDLLHMLHTRDPLLQQDFFSRQDLAERYHVAPATAQKILKALERKGCIQCRKGCRAKIRTSIQQPYFSGRKKILLLFHCKNQNEISGHLCQYILNLLREQLENLSCSVLPGFYRHDLSPDDLTPYDGIIVIFPLENHPHLRHTLVLAGKPYAGLSVKYSLANTVFIQMQSGLLEILYYLFNHRVRALTVTPLNKVSRLEQYWYML